MRAVNSKAGNNVRVLVFGAHPDDAEFRAGGLAAACRQEGHVVRMISVTDGGAGHHQVQPADLVRIRRDEAAAAGRVIGAEYETWDFPDGSLTASLEVRRAIIREIRRFKPDVVLSHRVIDYHPDHRAVGQAVNDAAFSVTVPAICPDVPALSRNPVLLYLADLFERPFPMHADLVLDVEPYVDDVVSMLQCHASQFFEWLPYLDGTLDQVPADAQGRREWVRTNYIIPRLLQRADRFRASLTAAYGSERGQAATCAEAFEVSELGSPLDDELRQRLFPFMPRQVDG